MAVEPTTEGNGPAMTTRYRRLLLTLVAMAPLALALPALDAPPAGATATPALSPARPAAPPGIVTFDGYPWTVKASPSPIGPGPNLFAADGPRVDASGALHLRIMDTASGWESSEVVLGPTLGYGTYRWALRGPVSTLDPNVVLGLFTYDSSDTSSSNREIDFEASRLGDVWATSNAQFVVQPWSTPGNLRQFTLAQGLVTTVSWTWLPGQVTFSAQVTKADGRTLPTQSWTSRSSSVPDSSTEQVHMNLWLFRGAPPSNGKPVSITVTSFQFTRAP